MEPIIEAIWSETDLLVREHCKAENAYFQDRTPDTLAANQAAAIAYFESDRRLLTACRSLAKLQATTLDGLICKARLTVHEDEDLVESIVADLIAMGARS
ncbi:hypothetical protein [Methylobacterium iners]|nr:hypothetical protein [Methylobacterium iners]